MAVIKEGTIIRKRKELKKFVNLKLQSIDDLEWCKWAGWMDTDGTMNFVNNNRRAILKLRDRQPVELLSNLFETTITYREHKTITPEPYRREYTAKEYITSLHGEKAIAFATNVYPYLLNEDKKEKAINLIGYKPESKNIDDWNKQEFIQYFATAFEGDGSVYHGKPGKLGRFRISMNVKSSNIQYLSDIKYLLDKHFQTCVPIYEHSTYQTKQGIKTKYLIMIPASIRKELFTLMIEPNVMTLDRKKNKIIEYLNQ
jgi:hypothetical protein